MDPTKKLTILATVNSSFPTTLNTSWSLVAPQSLLTQGFNITQALAVPSSSVDLVLKPNALPPRTAVTLRLSAADVGGAAYADVSLAVSGKPLGGGVSISPPAGTGLGTPFILNTSGWIDSDQPLMYAFSYTISSGVGGAAQEVFISPFSPFSSVNTTLPAGDPGAGYTLVIQAYAKVRRGSAVLRTVPVAEAAVVQSTELYGKPELQLHFA